jgi:hypothetical protein
MVRLMACRTNEIPSCVQRQISTGNLLKWSSLDDPRNKQSGAIFGNQKLRVFWSYQPPRLNRPVADAPWGKQGKWLKNNKEANTGTAVSGCPKKSAKMMVHQNSISRTKNNK